jgi:hypothetical protein
MTYGNTTTALHPTRWRKIQVKSNAALLSSLGFNPNIPSQVRHAPLRVGGCQIPDFTTFQGTNMIMTVLANIRHHGPLSNQLKIYFGWFQLLLGTTRSILSDPTQNISYVPGTWMQALCGFLRLVDCQLHWDDMYTVQLRRTGDESIMEHAVKIGFSAAELIRVQRCRIFLQVECISDITTADGLRLDPNLNNETPSVASSSTRLWPRQTLPGPTSWSTWRKLLRQLLIPKSKYLRRSLGTWDHLRHRHWPTYLDPESQYIVDFQPDTQRWRFHATYTGDISTKRYIPGLTVETSKRRPTTLLPIDTRIGRLQLDGWEQICAYRHSPMTHVTLSRTLSSNDPWEQHIESLPPWERCLLTHHKVHHRDVLPLYSQIVHGEHLYGVSDGSVLSDQSIGTFGWVIADEHDTLAEGWGLARGHPMDSFRAEAYGRLAMFRFVLQYLQFLDITSEAAIHTFTDCKSLIQRESRLSKSDGTSPSENTANHFDIVRLLVDTVRKMITSVHFLPYENQRKWPN